MYKSNYFLIPLQRPPPPPPPAPPPGPASLPGGLIQTHHEGALEAEDEAVVANRRGLDDLRHWKRHQQQDGLTTPPQRGGRGSSGEGREM